MGIAMSERIEEGEEEEGGRERKEGKKWQRDTLSRTLSLSSQQGFCNLLTKSLSLQQACCSSVIP